jgi:uncharacterized protein (TIGR02147 family)
LSARDQELRDSILRRMRALNPAREIRDLSVDLFKLIADWYHFAIRELTQLDGQELDPPAIARALGISPLEAEVALERLVRLELIEPDPARPGRYRKTLDHVLASSQLPNEALRTFNRQMLAKATDALETQSPQEKLCGSETFAISSHQLPEARAIMEEFFGRMVRLTGTPLPRDRVYHLNVQFFNLTRAHR